MNRATLSRSADLVDDRLMADDRSCCAKAARRCWLQTSLIGRISASDAVQRGTLVDPAIHRKIAPAGIPSVPRIPRGSRTVRLPGLPSGRPPSKLKLC
jgi:hypothetical protein